MKNTGRMEEVRYSWGARAALGKGGRVSGDKRGRDHPSGSFRLWKYSMQAREGMGWWFYSSSAEQSQAPAKAAENLCLKPPSAKAFQQSSSNRLKMFS